MTGQGTHAVEPLPARVKAPAESEHLLQALERSCQELALQNELY